MAEYSFYEETAWGKTVASLYSGGKSLGTLFDQKFYAVRAGGPDLNLPFTPRPFTALVDISREVEDNLLERYAKTLMSHGCVQAVCRGEGADRLSAIFDRLADEGGNSCSEGFAFTSMAIDDESLDDAIHYFVLPCGLASTGLVVVIGGNDSFRQAVECFSGAAGSLNEGLGVPAYVSEELACFEPA